LSTNRPGYRWTFWILGLAGVFVVGVAGWRNQKQQDSLQTQLSKIEQNTEKRQTITVNPRPVTVQPPNQPAAIANLVFTFLPLGPKNAPVKGIESTPVDGVVTVQFTAERPPRPVT
jgi:hypothetical protein